MADSTDIAAMGLHSMIEGNTISFLNHVFEWLVRYNQDLEVVPALRTIIPGMPRCLSPPVCRF